MAMKPIEILIRAKDEASSVMDLLKRNAAGIGAAIAGYFGFNAFAGAVKGAADLEAALSEVAAVSGAGAGEMGKLRAAAEEAGAATKYTATEAAVALGNLARAGLDSNQAIAALKPTLQLAQAGSIDLGQAAEITTKTIAGFGLAATDAGRIADVLAKGANASNTSVRGLGEAMSYAAPMAKTVGLDLESTVAIMGKFADGGIDASRAGTALNAILSQFADPSSKFKAALSDAGITTLDFNKALVQLAAKGKDGEKAMLAVGTEAGPALRSLLNQGIPALNELRAKLADAGGSAEATAKIMGDNLRGSMDGLSSAWDAVKLKLATPVLPVLKSGVDSLAASFKDAVESGVVGRFGDAIAKGFEASITWAKRFAAEVDFEAFAARMKSYAAQAGEAFDTIKAYATNAGNVVQTVWGTMSAGSNAVLTVIYAVGAGFAGLVSQFQQGLALIYEGMAKITFGNLSEQYKQLAADVRQSADATYAAGRELATKSIESFNKMAEGAQMARNGWDGISGSADESAQNIATAKRVIDDTATSLKAMGGDAQAAGQKAVQASVAQREAAEKALAKVVELRAEYEKARQSGDSGKQVEALQKLEHATNAAAVAMRGLNKENDAAKEKASALAAAFAGMGIKTKAELQTLADTAKARFDLIKASGQATAEGIASAWKQMTEAAIAANGGVATGTQKAQAAMYGLKIEVDATGKSIVVAMNNGSAATNGFTNAVNDSRTALERLNDERERSIAAQEKANELTQRAIDLENKRKGIDREGFSIDPKTGRRIEEAVPTRDGIYQQLVAGGMRPAQADTEAQRLAAQAQSSQWSGLLGGISSLGGGSAKSLQEQINDMLRANAVSKDLASDQSNSGRTASQTASAQSLTAKTYNVQLGAYTAKFDTDAQAQGFIAELKKSKLAA